MSDTYLTVAVRFDGGKADAVNVKLDEHGNPVIKDIRDMLRGGSVHVISINVLPADSDNGAFLVIEANQYCELHRVVPQAGLKFSGTPNRCEHSPWHGHPDLRPRDLDSGGRNCR